MFFGSLTTTIAGLYGADLETVGHFEAVSGAVSPHSVLYAWAGGTRQS
jgi:hypothetical protein